MAKVSPFRALRFTAAAGAIDSVVCPPYDIINEDERQALLALSPNNVIRLEKPSDYRQAADTLADWLQCGVLANDETPAFYVYQECFDDRGTPRRITGVIGDLELRAFADGVVLPHEETLPKARGDRRSLMEATYCNFSQIYCLYHDEQQAVTPHLMRVAATPPDVEFTLADGVTHRLWRVTDADTLAAIADGFADKVLYIADGHHRYTTALEFHQEHPGAATAGIMTMLVDMADDGLVIWPTHRLVSHLDNFNAAELLAKLHRDFHLTLAESVDTLEQQLAAEQDSVVFYAGGGHYALLTLRDRALLTRALPNMSEAYRTLDVALLHKLILEPVLGIGDKELAAQSHVSYTRSLAEALHRVDNGECQCAFILNTTRIDQLADVSRAGEKMPQKSTYFYPKLITGLVMKQLQA